MEPKKIIITSSPEGTKKYAAKLANRLKRGDVVGLVGKLGAGKTCFVQGLADGLSTDDSGLVRSPTFTIINEYTGSKPLYHIDLYRMRSQTEVAGLGLDDYFGGDGITVVEWADRFPTIFPKQTIWIKIEVISKNKRKISIISNYQEALNNHPAQSQKVSDGRE